ncbi:class F sortase [Modestobacter sp. VKM Ac-2983]|uniref:class F sortase n=1 Tax=Modestobacter sp. VKM Ac-2983 TaxID=3004137 RepID=UPI0022ABB2A3|nr:class F sortase [Modestobacter sp. VKM Ac-2983]MCZ2804272.1 class F sortase [Modestobacter sp. VKM Ac-2983]
MRTLRRQHLVVLVAAGAVLVGSGLATTFATPRADAPDIGSPVAAAPPSPASPPSAPTPPAATPSVLPPPVLPAPAVVPPSVPAPVTVSLPATPDPVPLVPVGTLDSGALQLPERPTVLGWYAAGAVPGDPAGTAVIAGHVDSAVHGAGPLETLLSLHEGDPVEVTDAAGGVHRFAVTSRTSFPKSALPAELFRLDGPPQLALITCGGAFDERTGNYADNVVVTAAPLG